MPTLKLLLIDGNQTDVELVREYLDAEAKNAFQLDVVSTLDEAVASLRRTAYDLVLLDPNFHTGDAGIRAVQRICTAVATSSAIVLILTEDESQALFAASFSACVQELLVKRELSARLLVRTLHTAVARQAQQRLRELQTDPAEPEIRQAEAMAELRKVNRPERTTSVATGRRLDDLTTGSLATETCLALFNERLDNVVNTLGDVRKSVDSIVDTVREIQRAQVGAQRELDVLKVQVRPIDVLNQGDSRSGLPSLATRLDRLETANREQCEADDRSRKTWWDVAIQVAPFILTWLGAALALAAPTILKYFAMQP